MRECIYCGRQLQKDEVCDCAISVAKRMERQKNEQTEPIKSKADLKNEEKEKKKRQKERVKEEKARARSERKTRSTAYRTYGGNIKINRNSFANVWRLFRDFIKSPIETIMNPHGMTVTDTILFVIFEGIISGLSAYSIITGTSRGSLRLIGNILGFNGFSGYNVIVGWIASAFSGAIGGILVFLLYSGIFYLINRWIFKQYTPYWDFSKKFAFVGIPFSIIGAIGVILGFFSQTTFAILLICGMVGLIILTYEILRSMWYSKSASMTMYCMMGGIFVFLLIALYIIRISVI